MWSSYTKEDKKAIPFQGIGLTYKGKKSRRWHKAASLIFLIFPTTTIYYAFFPAVATSLGGLKEIVLPATAASARPRGRDIPLV